MDAGDFGMLFRLFSVAAFLVATLTSSAASAGLVTVTSYDMPNGNGAAPVHDAHWRSEIF